MAEPTRFPRLASIPAVALGSLLLSASCTGVSGAEDYVGFGDELSMVEKYPSLPDLPVDQGRFVTELGELPVRWQKRSQGCPDPQSLDRDSKTTLTGCLLIQEASGDQLARSYIAFIDDEARVVLVENAFEDLGLMTREASQSAAHRR